MKLKFLYREFPTKGYHVNVVLGGKPCGYLSFTKEDFLWLMANHKDTIIFEELSQ